MVRRNDTGILGILLSDAFGRKGLLKHSHCNKISIKTVCRMCAENHVDPAQMPNENSTPTSMSLAIFTTFENCTDFSAALCRSSMEKILRPELFTCDVVSKR